MYKLMIWIGASHIESLLPSFSSEKRRCVAHRKFFAQPFYKKAGAKLFREKAQKGLQMEKSVVIYPSTLS